MYQKNPIHKCGSQGSEREMVGLSLHRCNGHIQDLNRAHCCSSCWCLQTPAHSCLLTFFNGQVDGTICALTCIDPCFFMQVPIYSMQRERSTLGKVSWLPCALHMVYQLRSGGTSFGSWAEETRCCSGSCPLHVPGNRKCNWTWNWCVCPSHYLQDSALSPGALSVWQRRRHLISTWEVMGWADGGLLFSSFLDRNTNVSENGVEA